MPLPNGNIARTERIELKPTVARVGGDEFTIFLPDISHSRDAGKVAQRHLDTIARPLVIGIREVFITASIGITVCPVDSGEVDTLLKNADTAMYHAKNQGKNNYQYYAESINSEASKRFAIETDLRRGLLHHELLLHYQLKVDIQTGAVVGVEALLRWQHPEKDLVLPEGFLKVAEESGLILPIGNWVFRTAAAQAKAWRRAGSFLIPLAVNLSRIQFRQRDHVEVVRQVISECGIAPHWFELELTESAVMQNA